MKEATINKLDAIDILTARIQQSKSIAGSLISSDAQILPQKEVNNILWGVTDLLEQALEAG